MEKFHCHLLMSCHFLFQEEQALTQSLVELKKFKDEAEVKLKDTIDFEHKSIELEERVLQLTKVFMILENYIS